MLHPERHRSRRRACGQSYWLGFLCKTLSFSIPSRFIPALSLTPFTLTPFTLTPANWLNARSGKPERKTA